MNREIRFRGCDKNGKWYYSLLLYKESQSLVPEIAISYTEKAGQNTFNMKVLPDTIGQFTGLKDAKGKDIYEGDIFKIMAVTEKGCPHIYYTQVVFKNGAFILKSKTENTLLAGWLDQDLLRITLSIVGNIHDNPKLLEQNGIK